MVKTRKLGALTPLVLALGLVMAVAGVVPASALANTPPVASFSYTRMVGSPNKVNLNGSASYDSDGTISSYKWYRSGVNIASGKTVVASMSSTGVSDVTLVVTDNQGATGSVTQTVLTPNRVPIITASAPASGAVLSTLTPTLTATGKDYDGDFLIYNFHLTGPDGVDLESPFLFSGSWTVPTNEDGTPILQPDVEYTWSVVVYDNKSTSEARVSTFTVVLPPVAPVE